jgi:hypothetical protein
MVGQAAIQDGRMPRTSCGGNQNKGTGVLETSMFSSDWIMTERKEKNQQEPLHGLLAGIVARLETCWRAGVGI